MNIIDVFYLGNIDEVSRIPNNEYAELSTEELKLYNELKDKLPNALIYLFQKYTDIIYAKNTNETKSRYIQGFKTGLLLAIECMNIEL